MASFISSSIVMNTTIFLLLSIPIISRWYIWKMCLAFRSVKLLKLLTSNMRISFPPLTINTSVYPPTSTTFIGSLYLVERNPHNFPMSIYLTISPVNISCWFSIVFLVDTENMNLLLWTVITEIAKIRFWRTRILITRKEKRSMTRTVPSK